LLNEAGTVEVDSEGPPSFVDDDVVVLPPPLPVGVLLFLTFSVEGFEVGLGVFPGPLTLTPSPNAPSMASQVIFTPPSSSGIEVDIVPSFFVHVTVLPLAVDFRLATSVSNAVFFVLSSETLEERVETCVLRSVISLWRVSRVVILDFVVDWLSSPGVEEIDVPVESASGSLSTDDIVDIGAYDLSDEIAV